MFTTSELRSLARSKRDSAARARRLAGMLSQTIDLNRLLKYAVELEGEADELDRQAGNAQ